MGKISFKRLAKLLPVLALVVILLTTAALASDTAFDTENFKGLVLTTTASDVSVTLYNGRTEAAAKMTPVYTDGTTYYYEVTAGNTYYYVAKPTSGTGRYNIRKNVYISAEEANTKTVLDVTPAKRTTGWDTWRQIIGYSDEAMAAAYPSSPDLWPDYDWVFTTPVFANKDRTPHKQTTQTEMMDYMGALDGADDNMYVYTLGKSGGSKASEIFDIPVVFFSTTDLSGATTWEDAAALVKANGKLTVMYQALIHGLEPAGGEAALAMLKALDGAYGENLLENMNICVIPRLNPYGVYMTYREVYTSGIGLRNIQHPDPLIIRFEQKGSDYEKLCLLAEKTGAHVKLINKTGIYWSVKGLIGRPVLVAGILLLALFTLYRRTESLK